jgi:ectoine hydroxylase-related dioxygenase (phytanoyl-CoA dioxygenase family)
MQKIAQLPPHLLAALPTEEDIAFYEEHGWYVTPKVLDDEIIDAAILATESYHRGERDSKLPVTTGYIDWKPGDGDGLRSNEFVSLQSDAFRRFVAQPIIGAIAARLARTSEIRLLDDQLIYKPQSDKKNNTIVGWHADGAYWATCSSHNLLTAWIPFHDINEERGTLVVLDGSHRWEGLEHTRFFNDPQLDTIEERLKSEGRSFKRVPINLKKGQIQFHHRWTHHASFPNRSSLPRLCMAIHLQDQFNHYQSAWGPDGRKVEMVDELFCRKLPSGDPDFSDPNVFPVLWRNMSPNPAHDG